MTQMSSRERFLPAIRPAEPHAPPTQASVDSLEGDAPARTNSSLSEVLAYQRDFLERSVLFLDVLRHRANNMLEHEQAGLPPLINFNYELLLDGRQLRRPANYALLRITQAGDLCWDDCVDPQKPPVVVLDPRAGHGPGLGGFKKDSEVGIALHTGHPVYFVVFFPEPCPRQKITDVLDVLKSFVAHVAELHGRKPILYGNCQAGWAVTLLSAASPGLSGPAVLNGSPLSYWSGEPGINPMRMMAGFSGGSWLPHFLGDLNQGRFDGAWLVQNFEALKPGNAIWDKYAKLFSEIDTEEERFLEFERWWNGFYRLSTEEIVAIVENLFIGNRLEQGTLRLDNESAVDLKQISNPIIVFASYGDNITPPHQALGWIPSVYGTTEALKKAGQRIVYLTNRHVGHLGIFVSAGVARFEHRAILEHLDRIESLEPGLYEMMIDNPTNDPDCAKDQYAVRFEPRGVEQVRFEYPEEAFAHVREVSEHLESVYRSLFSPWVRAMASPWLSAWLHWTHPMRVRTYMWSENVMPWMRVISVWADAIRCNRNAAPSEVPLKALERRVIDDVSAFWESVRKVRDAAQERAFQQIYGNEQARPASNQEKLHD